MSNVLADDTHHQIVALGRLGWSLRRIERTTGVRRETISGYLKAVGIVVPGRGRRRVSRAKPAISTAGVSTDSGGVNPAISTDSGEAKAATRAEVSTDSGPLRRPGRAPSASACEPYRELIAEALGRGRNAMAIWQDLVDDHGFTARSASVRRFVVTLAEKLLFGLRQNALRLRSLAPRRIEFADDHRDVSRVLASHTSVCNASQIMGRHECRSTVAGLSVVCQSNTLSAPNILGADYS